MKQLADFGLTREDEIRFQKKKGGAWHYGHPHGMNKDGSITVGTREKGMRALMPEHLQVKRTGPRGGTVWQAVGPETTSTRKS